MKNKSLGFEFFKYVSLNIIGMIGISCYILADTFFISNGVGALGLTALNLAIPVYTVINASALMFSIGSATKYAIFSAGNQKEEANAAFSNAVKISAIAGILFTLIGTVFSDNLAYLLGADETTASMTSTYIRTLSCFSVFFIFNTFIGCFVRNDKAPGLSMAAMVAGSLFNIVFDYIFVYPLNMGMFGAALATGISPMVGLAVLSVHFIKRKNNFKFIKCAFRIKEIYYMCRLGIAAFITEISSGIVIIVFNMLILNISGNIGVAAYGIVVNTAIVVLSVFTGITQGLQPLLSRSYGKGNLKDTHKLLRMGIILSLIISLGVYFIVFLNSKIIVDLFNESKDYSLSVMAQKGIKIYFAGFLFAGMNIVAAAFFAAVEKPKEALLISVLRGILVIIPCVIIFSQLFSMNGVWLSFLFTEFITFIAVIIFYLRINKKGRI